MKKSLKRKSYKGGSKSISLPKEYNKIEIFKKIRKYKKRKSLKIKHSAGSNSNTVIDYLPFINNNFIVWTLTSNGYKDLTFNLYNSLKKNNVHWILMIICVDNKSYNFFKEQNIPSVLYKSSNVNTQNSTNLSIFQSDSFMDFNRLKLELIEKIRLESPEQVKYIVYMDGDIVIFKDFMPYLIDILSKDTINHIYFQVDNFVDQSNSIGCSGFFIMDRAPLSKSPFLVEDLNKWNGIREDQIWINNHLNEYKIPFGYLDRKLFPNGAFMYNNSNEWSKLNDAYILHYNFMVGKDKINNMKKNNHWYI